MENKIENKSPTEIRDFLANHSYGNIGNEICGFVGFDEDAKKFVASIEKNEATDPRSYFVINPVNYLKFKDSYSLLGVFHSHIAGDENPSQFDIKMSESCCIPFVIFSINSKKFHVYEPQNSDCDVKILGRLKAKLK